MNKQQLRTRFLNKRNTLSKEDVKEKSKLIFNHFFDDIEMVECLCVHCFLPIIKNNEIDTTILINELQKRNIQVVVPVSNFNTHEMEAALYSPQTPLTIKKGIPEPTDPQHIDPNLIDLMILPLAIFDNKGFRIGYGGGFYDRFLAKLESKPKLIGVSFFEAIDDIYPNEFDVPLDYCLTPSKTYFFK